MSEEELESKEEDFQQKMIEFMMNAKTQLEAMSGRMQRLEQRIMKASEEEILEEGFKSYSFTPFPKSNKGKQKRQEEGDESISTDNVDESDEVSTLNKKQDNDDEDSDDDDDDEENDKKKVDDKKSRRKSFMREANEAGSLTKGFQQVIVQPPTFNLMLKTMSKDVESVKYIKKFISKFNHHYKLTPMGHEKPKMSRNIIDPVLQVLMNWYMANRIHFDKYLPPLPTDTLEEFGESDNDCVIKIITHFIRPTTAEDQLLLFKSIDPSWGSLDPANLKMETFIEQYNVLTKYISDLESMYKFIFDFDLRKDVNHKARKVFAETMKKSMPHFERDHSKPSLWKVATNKMPGSLRKMTFDEAKKEAEGKVKLAQMKVFSEGDANVSVMDIAKRMLVEALKVFNNEISTFNKNYQVDKLLDPTARLTSLKGDQLSEHSLLDEDMHQEMSDQREDQAKEEDSMNNIAPSTPTGQGGGNKWQGGASKQLPTIRSSHPTRDLYRTDKDRSKAGVCFKYARNGAGPNGCDRGESCYYSHDPQLCKEFLRQSVDEQRTKRDKLMMMSQCLGSPQLVEVAKELGDEYEAFHSLLQSVE